MDIMELLNNMYENKNLRIKFTALRRGFSFEKFKKPIARKTDLW